MLKLEEITKYYNSGETVALGLSKVSLEMHIGEFIAITGESGSGKSTLLNVISGLDTYEDGEMFVAGEETSYYSSEDWELYRRQYVGFVFQNYNIIDSYTVYQNVEMALIIQGYDPALRKERVLELIDKVGLTSHAKQKASKLSGGQKQRCVIARALAKDCPIILCDEPTGNLDVESSKNIINILHEISKEKLVVVVTHNYDEIAEHATRKIRLYDGKIAEDEIIYKVTTKEIIAPEDIEVYKLGVKQHFGIAKTSLLSVPKKSIFTLLVTFILAFVIFFIYGTYVEDKNIDYNYTYHRYFDQLYPGRIVVDKYDGSVITDEDYQEIASQTCTGLGNKNCISAIINDQFVDSDFYQSNFEVFEEDIYEYHTTFEHLPASILDKNDLDSGTLPKNDNEIVYKGYNSNMIIGDTITLGYEVQSDYYGYPIITENDDAFYEFVIVGIIDDSYRRSIYFNKTFYLKLEEDIIEYSANVVTDYSPVYDIGSYNFINSKIDIEMQSYTSITINESLDSNTIILSTDFITNYIHYSEQDYSIEYRELDDVELFAEYCLYNEISECNIDAFSGVINELVFKYPVIYNSNAFKYNEKVFSNVIITDDITKDIQMNSEVLSSLNVVNTTRISVFAKDSYDARQIQSKLDKLGYNTIIPADNVDNNSGVFQKIQNAIFFVYYLTIFFALYMITYLVLKNVIFSKKKNYLIYRSVGTSKSSLYKINILELIILMSLSFILVLVFLIINEYILSKPLVYELLKYYKPVNILVFYIILLSIAILLGTKSNKKLFKKSVITAMKED